ncbi:MAG: ThuA domain-containing protein [Opitutaceae bacterium]
MKIRLLYTLLTLTVATALQAADRKLVMIAGPVSHPTLQHEFRAGSMLLQKRLENVRGLKTVLVTNGWPSKTVDGKKVDDNSVFEGADAIFIYGDGGTGHLALQNDRLEVLRGLMAKGVSLGCAHYAVEVPAGKGGAEWKAWIGGFYEDKVSVNPIWDANYTSFPNHPVTRGVKPFTTKDEWYFNIQFPEGKTGVTNLLVATPSDAVRDGPYVSPRGPYPHVQAAKGQPETMMWAIERRDGGRGFGFTGGHYHVNWQNDDQRRLMLNALVWLAKLDVPARGIDSPSVSDVEIQQNLDVKPAPRAPAATPPTAPKSDPVTK